MQPVNAPDAAATVASVYGPWRSLSTPRRARETSPSRIALPHADESGVRARVARLAQRLSELGQRGN